MAKMTFGNTVAHALRQNDLRQRTAAARVTAREAENIAVVPRLEVKTDDLPPVEADISIHFVSSGNQPGDLIPKKIKSTRPRGLAAVLNGFTRNEMDSLRKLEPQLLKWISANRKNAARFFADPLGALKLAGINVDKKLVKKIKRIRTRSSFVRAELPHAAIKSIKVGGSRVADLQNQAK